MENFQYEELFQYVNNRFEAHVQNPSHCIILSKINTFAMLLLTLYSVVFFSAALMESKLINTFFLNKERFLFVCT